MKHRTKLVIATMGMLFLFVAQQSGFAATTTVKITAVRGGSLCRDQHGNVLKPSVVPVVGLKGADDTADGIISETVNGRACYLFEAEAGVRPFEACPAVEKDALARIHGTRGRALPGCDDDSGP